MTRVDLDRMIAEAKAEVGVRMRTAQLEFGEEVRQLRVEMLEVLSEMRAIRLALLARNARIDTDETRS